LTSGRPDTALIPKTDAVRTTSRPRPTASRIVVTVETTSHTRIRRKGVHHRAHSASRKTPATGVDGGRRLFHTTRPLIHHQQEYPQRLSGQQATQGRTAHLQPHRISAPLRTTGHAGQTCSPAASPYPCVTPDNQLPRTHSLACSYTRLLRIFADRLPGTQMPVAGGQRHTAPDFRPPPHGIGTTPSSTNPSDNAQRTTAEPTSHADHPFRPTRPLPDAVQRVSTILREAVMWVQPTSLSAAPHVT
jgi:hypothetical protein